MFVAFEPVTRNVGTKTLREIKRGVSCFQGIFGILVPDPK